MLCSNKPTVHSWAPSILTGTIVSARGGKQTFRTSTALHTWSVTMDGLFKGILCSPMVSSLSQRLINLATIWVQKVQTKNTLLLYICNPQLLRNHKWTNTQLELAFSMYGSLFPRHSSNVAVHWLEETSINILENVWPKNIDIAASMHCDLA